MPGESPLSMMRPAARQARKPGAGPARRPWRRLLALVAIVIVLALGWVWLWYNAAAVADRTLAGWMDREAAEGRVYSCGSRSIGGFPFGIAARCADAAAEIRSNQPPYAVKAKGAVFAAALYHPTGLTGDIAGPLTLAELGQAPSFAADWARARLSVSGRPPNPERVSVSLEAPHLGRVGAAAGGNGEMLFAAKQADLEGRMAAGAPNDHPVIEATLKLTGATAPTLHPLTAAPIDVDFDAVLRGFKDLAPKSWVDRFREMQAAGGGVEIKSLRFTRGDAIVVGAGTLSVNAHGKLDGVIRVAIVGLEQIVPLLGIDRLIGQGLDRLAGADLSAGQGLGALDRLMPGLGAAVRETANASLIENIKKMGQPATVDNKSAIMLPLRFADGSIYLGMLRVGEAPPLF
ncbi:MAG: DUF2125 domain-containing protein [Xanthobacteraceae bacterium]|jgi:hypothetical protein